MRPNPVKTKLAAGEIVYGTMVFEFLSPGLPQILANSGADFVFYDLEHSGFTIEDMKTQFALCAGAGVIPFARPPGKDYQFTARMLDVAQVGSLDEGWLLARYAMATHDREEAMRAYERGSLIVRHSPVTSSYPSIRLRRTISDWYRTFRREKP